MKSFCVLIKEDDGAIALCNQNRQDYCELLLSNYVPIREGGRKELSDFLEEYFDANGIPMENRIYLTIN